MKVLAIAWTGLRRTLRRRINLFFLFVFPMLMILVLGLAFGGSFQPRVGVAVLDHGPLAGQLAARLQVASPCGWYRTSPASSRWSNTASSKRVS